MKSIKILALVGTIALAMTNGANAQESPATSKQYSIGPAIEFGGAGTSFGIKGKIGVSPQFSIRPTVLFGYKPTVSGSDLLNGSTTVSGSLIPGGSATAANNTLPNIISSQSLGDFGSGTAYGVALTYDFRSPDNKITGYIGPSILFGSASRSVTDSGISATSTVSETNIGLTTGTDFAISDNFTIGLNATYNFFRSGTYSVNIPGSATFPATSVNGPISGGNFKFGVNAGYSF